MNDDQRTRVRGLILEQRWAALATLAQDGGPSISFVAYTPDPGFTGFLIHVSRLASHTHNMLTRPAVALAISETDAGEIDPQQLARITIHGTASVIRRGTSDYISSRERYLTKLPQSERLFGFEDFVLIRLLPREARYVGGFANAFTLTAAQLEQISDV